MNEIRLGFNQVNDRSLQSTPLPYSLKVTGFTTDLALKMDPAYQKIAMRFRENPEEFRLAFAKAWFKLTHRDMGPKSRYVGSEVPQEDLLWQDPLPKVTYKPVDAKDIAALKAKILASGLTAPAEPHMASLRLGPEP